MQRGNSGTGVLIEVERVQLKRYSGETASVLTDTADMK